MKFLILSHEENIAMVFAGQTVWKSRRFWFELTFTIWIIGSQIWYYLQFKEQFVLIARVVLRRLWH